jgi:hypothetical protein
MSFDNFDLTQGKAIVTENKISQVLATEKPRKWNQFRHGLMRRASQFGHASDMFLDVAEESSFKRARRDFRAQFKRGWEGTQLEAVKSPWGEFTNGFQGALGSCTLLSSRKDVHAVELQNGWVFKFYKSSGLQENFKFDRAAVVESGGRSDLLDSAGEFYLNTRYGETFKDGERLHTVVGMVTGNQFGSYRFQGNVVAGGWLVSDEAGSGLPVDNHAYRVESVGIDGSVELYNPWDSLGTVFKTSLQGKRFWGYTTH